MRVFLSLSLAVLLAMSAGFISACDRNAAVPASAELKIQGRTMGTFYTVTLPGGFKGGAQELTKLAEQAFDQVDKAISTFNPNSEISKFNQWQSTEPFKISAYLADIIENSRRYSRSIDGAMDFSVGPLVNLWGFGPEGRPQRVPDEQAVHQVRQYVGLQSYELRRNDQGEAFLVKHDPRVKLDLSTVGEGLGSDLLADKLNALGIKDYLIAVAGAIRSQGVNAKGQPWRLGIEDPQTQGTSVFAAVCPLNQAMSTAGSYRNYFVDEKTGERYSHVIDPKTGAPIKHHTVSVTVIAPTALQTDALDTGLLVWGAQQAVAFGNTHDLAVYAIEFDAKGKAHGSYSKAFKRYLDCKTK